MSYTKGSCNRFKQISKGWFYQTTVAFHQKSILFFLISFTNILIYGIFSGLFLDNLEWFFFLKIMVAEKNIFLSNAWHNFAKWQSHHHMQDAPDISLTTRALVHMYVSTYNKVFIRCRTHYTLAADVGWCRLHPAADDGFAKNF